MEWDNGVLRLLDQRFLPLKEIWNVYSDCNSVAIAIEDMVVRGAPAIGIVAAYGMALAMQNGENFEESKAKLAATRPTAVNLFWALDRLERLKVKNFESVLAEARKIDSEDLEMNLAIGENGLEFVKTGARILTICNTGALATGGHGTALGIIRSAYKNDRSIFVYSCETRPRQQGLRLTAWELLKENIPFKSIADSAAGWLMAQGQVDLVIAGADRIAANGDTANKIGTYALAVLAKYHGIPFLIAAPVSTFDPKISSGISIPIEEREASELTEIDGVRVAPHGIQVFNPAFDVTPNNLIHAIVTEKKAFRPPYLFN